MTMTPNDIRKFELVLAELSKWQNKKLLGRKPDTAEIADLVERVENLEKLLFFELCNSAGEQGLTPELKRLMKQTGFWELWEAFNNINKLK